MVLITFAAFVEVFYQNFLKFNQTKILFIG